MLTAWQVECPSVTPSVVLEASGHVERFTDFMVRDFYRAKPQISKALVDVAIHGWACLIWAKAQRCCH